MSGRFSADKDKLRPAVHHESKIKYEVRTFGKDSMEKLLSEK